MLRLNPDEQFRQAQRRHVVDCSLQSHVSLLTKKLRAGLLSRKDCEQAAIFGHKAAAQMLETRTNQLHRQLASISTFSINQCLNFCAVLGYHIIRYYAESIIGGDYSSEERALNQVSEPHQDQVSYLFRVPYRALNLIDNEALAPASVTAQQAAEVVSELCTIETMLNEHPLEGRSRANRHVISSLECGLHCVVFRRKRQVTRHTAACYQEAIEATKQWHSCNEEEAVDILSECILERLFPNV